MHKCTSWRQFPSHFRTRQTLAFSQTTRATRTETVTYLSAVTWCRGSDNRISKNHVIRHNLASRLRPPSVISAQRSRSDGISISFHRLLDWTFAIRSFALSFAFYIPIWAQHTETPCPASLRIKSVSVKYHKRLNHDIFKIKRMRNARARTCYGAMYSSLQSQSIIAWTSARDYF